MVSSNKPVIRPGGQSDQLSTSEFSFSSVLGRVSRSSPPFQTKCHAQELATYSCFLIRLFFFFMMCYCNHWGGGATTCFYSCSHSQFHSLERAAAFMAINPRGQSKTNNTEKHCVRWICAPTNKHVCGFVLGLDKTHRSISSVVSLGNVKGRHDYT